MITLNKALNNLITRNYDAEKGYNLVASEMQNSALKTIMSQCVKERYRFGHDIKAIMKDLNFEIEKGTSIEGDLHRTWMTIRETLSSSSDEAIIDEAIRGEQFALKAYEEILERTDLQPGHRDILTNHLESINRSMRDLKAIKESMAVVA